MCDSCAGFAWACLSTKWHDAIRKRPSDIGTIFIYWNVRTGSTQVWVISKHNQTKVAITWYFNNILSKTWVDRRGRRVRSEALPGVGMGVGMVVYLFPWFPEINRLVPLFPTIKILISYVPVPLIFRPFFLGFPEINALVPLFPQNHGRASEALTSSHLVLRGVYEPRHNKTYKVTMRPAKTRISLGIRPVWSESSLCA